MMKVIYWNIRGLNNQGKHRYLKEKLKKEKPQIMLLQETKISTMRFESILQSFKPHYEVMVIDARGTAGGIAILWNPAEVIADDWIGLQCSLSGCFRHVGTKENLMITAVYGPHLQGEKQKFLDSLRALRLLHQEKYWLIGGNFNLILNLNEKKGGTHREDPEMESFRDLLTDLHLVDIPTKNGIFTWNNRRGESHQIASHLDRFLASKELISLDIYFEASKAFLRLRPLAYQFKL